MADGRHARGVFWVDPPWRGIVPLRDFHIPKSLRKTLRRRPFEVAVDRDFPAVVAACAEEREATWINGDIERACNRLHRAGCAHSVECRAGGALVGGLYGVRLAGAFFGESMFSRARDASKVALVHLVMRLLCGGFRLLDTQFVTAHLQRFGAVEVPRATYRALLSEALTAEAEFSSPAAAEFDRSPRASFVQSMTQMS